MITRRKNVGEMTRGRIARTGDTREESREAEGRHERSARETAEERGERAEDALETRSNNEEA